MLVCIAYDIIRIHDMETAMFGKNLNFHSMRKKIIIIGLNIKGLPYFPHDFKFVHQEPNQEKDDDTSRHCSSSDITCNLKE